MSTKGPDIITRYFAADAGQDIDALVALFTDDAVVIDEGLARPGAAEIRAWRDGVASVTRYTTEVLGIEATCDGSYLALAHLEDNFPGGTIDLKHHFTMDGGRIRRLEIAP